MSRAAALMLLAIAVVGWVVTLAFRDADARDRTRCASLYTVAHTRADSLLLATGATCTRWLPPTKTP